MVNRCGYGWISAQTAVLSVPCSTCGMPSTLAVQFCLTRRSLTSKRTRQGGATVHPQELLVSGRAAERSPSRAADLVAHRSARWVRRCRHVAPHVPPRGGCPTRSDGEAEDGHYAVHALVLPSQCTAPCAHTRPMAQHGHGQISSESRRGIMAGSEARLVVGGSRAIGRVVPEARCRRVQARAVFLHDHRRHWARGTHHKGA